MEDFNKKTKILIIILYFLIRIILLTYIILIYNLLNNMRVYDFNFLSNHQSLINGTYKMMASERLEMN